MGLKQQYAEFANDRKNDDWGWDHGPGGIANPLNSFGNIAGLFDSFSGKAAARAANQQAAAADRASQREFGYLTGAFDKNQANARQGADIILNSGARARGALDSSVSQGMLEQGYGQGASSLRDTYGQSAEDLRSGYAGARDQLYGARQDTLGYSNAGRSALGQGYGEARGAAQDISQRGSQIANQYMNGATRPIDAYNVNGMPSRTDAMLGGLGGLYQGFEQDPGYQFRQQQGEQAINRAASAQGGRLGGGTMKALADYNSGLASQEFGNFAQRQQYQAGLGSQLASTGDANQNALAMNQAGRSDAARLNAQQNAYGLTQSGIGMQGQGDALRSQLASNYGQNLAGLYGSTGSALSNLGMIGAQNAIAGGAGQSALTGMYGQNLSNLQIQGGQTLAQNANQGQLAEAGIYERTGIGQANALTNGAAGNGQLATAAANSMGLAVPYVGGGANAMQNQNNQNMGNLLTLAKLFI